MGTRTVTVKLDKEERHGDLWLTVGIEKKKSIVQGQKVKEAVHEYKTTRLTLVELKEISQQVDVQSKFVKVIKAETTKPWLCGCGHLNYSTSKNCFYCFEELVKK